MNRSMTKTFKNPGNIYRGAPFWAWNGKLDPDELRRQIRVMNQMGLGGFFMHSRVGLDTGYLSKDWFNCIHACVDEAKKLGMSAWLYDEDRWPSGAAGGLVTKNPEYRMKSLLMKIVRNPGDVVWNKDTLAVYTAVLMDGVAHNLKKIARGSKTPKLAKNESFLVFDVEPQSCTSWHNGFTYLDTMNHEAVREFIKVTHESYLKEAGKEFGKSIPGIFTDEPYYGSVSDVSETLARVPWTNAIPSVFRKRYGYDILSRLPQIFLNIKDEQDACARHHYFDCITYLFTDAFARQVGEWCGKNKLLFTGHVLAEETLSSQQGYVGSAMRFYEHMQAPGMDILTEHSREYDTAKQVVSAARQFGRKWRLTETYGCTGWDFNFAGHKSVGDWQVAMGINFRCQHLSWYTMEGQAKRDYPASIFFQNPWWESYSRVEDYFARLHSVLAEGVDRRDVLVVHPNETMWMFPIHGARKNPEIAFYNKALVELRDSLLFENIDFDYGDEDILARHGRVSSKTGAPVFRVGKALYKAVVVPPMKTVRRSTLKLLEKFRAAGGLVVFAGNIPEYIDAVPSDEPSRFAGACRLATPKGRAVAAAVEPAGRLVSIRDDAGHEIAQTLHLLKETSDAYHLFICNTGYSRGQIRKWDMMDDPSMIRDRKTVFESVHVSVMLQSAGQCLELDTETGDVFSVSAKFKDDALHFATSLPALGSRLFRIPKKRDSAEYPRRPERLVVRRSKIKAGRWNYALSECNSLVLDMPRSKIGSGAWIGPREVIFLDRSAREAVGIPRRGGQMVQPWARAEKTSVKSTRIELEYSFAAESLPSGDLFVGIERPETFEIYMNGNHVSKDAESGWWCDKSLRKIPLNPGFLKKGDNTLRLVCNYDENHPGLEIVYLLGNFGVKVDGTKTCLTELPASMRIGDWVKQGLPFYSGSVCYTARINPKLGKGERLFVSVPEYNGTAVRIGVAGQPAGIIGWAPNEIDITGLVKKQPEELLIEVLGHRRNSHGPLHHVPKWPKWVGPGEFEVSDKNWSDEYQLVPCGLMSVPELVVKR